MAIAPTAPNYEQPPRHWPFGPLGRTAFLVVGLLLLCATLIPFLGSIAVAAVFALGLQGPVTALTKKIGQRRKLATSLVVGLLTLLVFLPAMFVALRAAKMFANAKNQGAEGLFSSATAEKVQGALSRAEAFIGRYGVSTHIFQSADEAKELVQQAGSEVGAKALSLASAAVTSAPQIFLTFLVFLLFLYMFLAHDQRVRRFFVNLNVFRRPDTERMTQILQASAYNSLVSNFFVGIMQASIITIAARAVGFQETILIFVAVFAISYIPFIGAAPVGYALAGLSLIGGNTSAAIIMAVVATFAGLIDNVIRPYLVGSGDVKVHPVVSFASLIGAIAVFGAKGIFLGPVILTSTVSLLGRAEKIRDRKGAPSRSPENKAAAS